jgi:histidyl-tRNA synthetase
MTRTREETPVAEPIIRCIEGTRDYFGADGARFDRALRAAERIFGLYDYERIHTPAFERPELFARSIGEATDIVEKEMYTFTPGSDTITLRPEGTAGVVRAILQRNLHKQGGLLKLWYGGPMFRRERPQKGRQRQFHQVGVEAVGADDPLLDTEVVEMALHYYAELGLDDVGTRLNSIGCPKEDCRPAYRRLLRVAAEPRLGELCENCRRRFDRNILRLLDCKNPDCREITKDFPKSHENLCESCETHFAAVREALGAGGVSYRLDGTLVRGLDYYTRTVFEFTHESLGAQDAIGAGGRYDGLVEELGGPALPAVGFALGVERILIALEARDACACTAPLQVFGIALGEGPHKAMSGLLARLRRAGLSADMDFEGRSMKAQMRRANRRGALLALILGEDELARGEVALKAMSADGGQETVRIEDLLSAVRAHLPA